MFSPEKQSLFQKCYEEGYDLNDPRINHSNEVNSASSSVSSASATLTLSQQSNESSSHQSKQSNESSSHQSKQSNESLPSSHQSKQSNESLPSSHQSKQSNESLSSSLDVISKMLVLSQHPERSKKGRKQAVNKTTVCITEKDILCNLKQKEADQLDKEAQKKKRKKDRKIKQHERREK